MKLKPTLLTLALMLAFGPAIAAEQSEAERAAARKELEAARGELRTLTKRIAELSMQLGDHGPRAFAFEFADAPRRALIGVVLAPDANGAKIAAVTPGGPAAKAGLKAGDLILSINGKSMGKDKAAVDGVRDSIGALEAGTAVNVRYQRDGKTMDAKMVAERREPGDWVGMLDLPNIAPLAKIEGLPEKIERDVQVIINGDGEKTVHALRRFGNGPMAEHMRILSGGLDLNLTTVNPDLGKYFGANSGVLVLENDGGKLPQIKAGDVIQVIDGQPADNVPGAMRLLTAKEPGQVLNIEVLRDRKKLVLAVEAPERDDLFFRVPAPPAPPAPPASAAPPAPPAPPSPPAAAAPPAPPAPPKAVMLEGDRIEWIEATPRTKVRVAPVAITET